MIRKTFIAILTTLGFSTALALVASTRFPVHWESSFENTSRWYILDIRRGHVTLFRYEMDADWLEIFRTTRVQTPEGSRRWKIVPQQRPPSPIKGWRFVWKGYWGPKEFGTESVIEFPLWGPALLFSAYPASAFIHGPVRRWRRRRKGWCVQCGYDLTGNVSGVCPECGESVGRREPT